MSKVHSENIGEICEKYNKIFGANKNLYRTIPSMIDGLKPGARRLLWTLYKKYDRKKKTKVAEIAGAVLAVHPHGNVAIEDTLVALEQDFSNNCPLIDGRGNFGTQAGSPHAAGRYIEASMSEYAWECFFKDFKDSNVDMKLTYTGQDYEPEFLPAKYPNALINGSLGIGYGLSSNIPPYNFKEVIEATIRLIKEGPDINVTLVPDSPTGAYILDYGEFGKISKTGSGSYTMRSVVNVNDSTNVITIKNCPYQVNARTIKNSIIELRNSGDSKNSWVKESLLSIDDRSNYKNGVMLQLKLKQDVNAYEFLEKLYSRDVGLQKTYPVNVTLIDDYTNYDYNIKSFLLDWLSYRRELKQAQYSFKLTKALEEQHINNILLEMTKGDNGKVVIDMATHSKTSADFRNAIMKKFSYLKMTTLQASAIADMKVTAFTKEAHESYQTRKKELIDEIKHLEDVMVDPSYIDKDIIDELEDGAKKFGTPRRSKVINMVKKKDIPNSNHIVVISRSGACKKLSASSKSTGAIGKGNEAGIVIPANNRDNLLVFDEHGMVVRVSVSSLPDAEPEDSGVPISRYSSELGSIVSVIKEDSSISDLSGMNLVFVTRSGYVKGVNLTEFAKLRSAKSAIKLGDGDLLVDVILTPSDNKNSSESLLIYTNMGEGLRVSLSEVPEYTLNSKGQRQIVVSGDTHVYGACKLPAKCPTLLYVTNNGKVKRTEGKYLPVVSRKSDHIKLIDLEDGERLNSIMPLPKGECKLIFFKKSSSPTVLNSEDVPLLPRIAKPKKMIPVSKGDFINGIKIEV